MSLGLALVFWGSQAKGYVFFGHRMQRAAIQVVRQFHAFVLLICCHVHFMPMLVLIEDATLILPILVFRALPVLMQGIRHQLECKNCGSCQFWRNLGLLTFKNCIIRSRTGVRGTAASCASTRARRSRTPGRALHSQFLKLGCC